MSAVIEAGLTPEQSEMVEANLGLIGFTLNRYCRQLFKPTYTEDDAWQEGFFGLCRAVQLFDPEHARLSTYAVQWIRQAVQRGAGQVEGRNYRRAVIHGDGSHADAVSLNVTVGDGSTEMADLFPATDDVEAEGIGHDVAAHLVGLARRQCRDGLDGDLIEWLADPADHRRPGDVCAELAARHGMTVGSVRGRLYQLRERCRRSLDASRQAGAA